LASFFGIARRREPRGAAKSVLRPGEPVSKCWDHCAKSGRSRLPGRETKFLISYRSEERPEKSHKGDTLILGLLADRPCLFGVVLAVASGIL
jgi:hypothetical protein